MKAIPPVVILAVLLGVTLGLPLGLYALLTRGRRRLMREIRQRASARGWKFRRRWGGDPTSFRIDGWGGSGHWTLKSGSAGEATRGWAAELSLRFPALAGDVDVALVPRDSSHAPALLAPHRGPNAQNKVAAFSGTAASALGFFREAHELPTRVPEFDAAYRLLALPARLANSPVDAALAQRLLHWPADALAPHSLLAWRDPFGLHFQARLPSVPDWPTITYFISLAEDLASRLPAPSGSSAPRGIVDSLAARLMGS